MFLIYSFNKYIKFSIRILSPLFAILLVAGCTRSDHSDKTQTYIGEVVSNIDINNDFMPFKEEYSLMLIHLKEKYKRDFECIDFCVKNKSSQMRVFVMNVYPMNGEKTKEAFKSYYCPAYEPELQFSDGYMSMIAHDYIQRRVMAASTRGMSAKGYVSFENTIFDDSIASLNDLKKIKNENKKINVTVYLFSSEQLYDISKIAEKFNNDLFKGTVHYFCLSSPDHLPLIDETNYKQFLEKISSEEMSIEGSGSFLF